MSNDTTTPYIPRNAGDQITAEDWNDVQVQIKNDIDKKVKEAIEKINNVPNAGNAEKLENKTADKLSEEILERARKEIPARTGYRNLFKQCKPGETTVIKHGLAACPLVDIYVLKPFPAVCSHDDKNEEMDVTFYLYHTREKQISVNSKKITIEETNPPAFKIAFQDMLSLYKVEYTDTTSLGDLEVEFWEKFFSDPNDPFDADQYCHSPWFDRCCGENRTVKDLRQRGDWDDIWFKMMPIKQAPFVLTVPNDDICTKVGEKVNVTFKSDTTANVGTGVEVAGFEREKEAARLGISVGAVGIQPSRPLQTAADLEIKVEAAFAFDVVHYDFNTLGIKEVIGLTPIEIEEPSTLASAKLMVLLKV